MSFIANNPIMAAEATSPPPLPKKGTRGFFPKEDGWYDYDEMGNVTRISTSTELKKISENYEVFKYYGDKYTVPSDESLFEFGISVSNGKGYLKSVLENITGDVVIPYKFTKDGREYLVEIIGAFAFENSSSTITGVTIPDSVMFIRSDAFSGCTGLTKMIIPDSVIEIGESAFDGCSSLTNITLSDNLRTIKMGAFTNCNNLTDVYYKGSPEDWNLIGIGSGNEALLNATIHYNWRETTKGYVDEKLATKVDKVEGKGLSSNDYTDTDKEKVDSFRQIYIQPDEPTGAIEGSLWIDTDEELGTLPIAEEANF